MKHFNFKTLAMGAALAGSLFTTNAVQAQNEYTDPNAMTVGYYHVVSVDNPEYAWTVLPSKEMAVAKLDKSKPEFVWFLTGRNGTGSEDEIGTKIVDQGSAYRLRFRFGNPAWTAGETFYAMGGLGSNADQQLLTIDKEWGMHNWRDVNETGFRFNASNRGYDVAPLNKSWNNGAKLWYYNNAGNAGRWKLEPVSEEVLTALKAIEDVEAFIAGLPDYAEDIAAAEAEAARLAAIEASGAVAAAQSLAGMKANIGTEEGQYNYTPADEDAELWNSVENYTDRTSEAYKGLDEEGLATLAANLKSLVEKVKATLVERNLGLPDVSVVTLQWGGAGRYVGINGGTGWDNQNNTFGSPNGGNGRIGIIKKEDGTFAIATQGIYMTIDENGAKGNAYTLDDATSFTVTRSSDNGLTFKAANGYYLVNQNFDTSMDAPTTDYKVNSYNVDNSYSLKASQDLVKVNDTLYMSAICLPFKVQKPEGEGFHTYIIKLEDGKIVTEEVDVVEAGVPFIYVSPINDDNKRLLIPQENQAYVSLQEATAQSIMMGWYLKGDNGEGDATNNYYYAVRNGVFGFYTDATPADVNQAAISGEAVKELGAAFFTWNAETKKLEAATNTAKVTYNVSYNGAIIKSEVATSVLGDKFAVPSTLAAPFTTFSLSAEDSTKVVEGDCEVTLYAAWNAPFEVSTSLEEAHWYNLDIRNGHWVRVQATEPYQPIAKGDVDNATLRTAEYQWAFMGDPYNLYIYNKSTGEMTLKAEDSAPLMREGQYSWELLDNNQGTDAFALRARGTAQKYINQEGGGGNGRKFGYWDNGGARNDGGSTFRVYEVPLLVNEAIALFMELNKVVTDVAMNPDNYEYTYTEADNALLDGGYEDAAAYEGKSEEEVLALMAEFQALINRLKDARPTGLKALNIVTLKWNNYVTLTAEGKWAGIIAPNDAYGKIAIIKKEAGYLLSAQGMYLKMNEDQTTAIVADDAEATLLTIKGTVADGLTISANGLYLTGEELSVVAERPTQTYKVNEYANTNLIATKEEMVEAATKLYMSDFCFPFSVTKPENEKEHHFYTLQVADLESEKEVNIIEMVEVDTVLAGVPFIYITNSKEDTETRLVILPDSVQTYAATPTTEGLLNGYYMIPTVEEGNFYYGEEDWYYGYYNTAKPQSANGAYITAAAAEAIAAAKFWFDDKDLVFKATNANGVDITTGISPVVNHAVNGAIYNLQGVRVAQPTKGIYIINGQKVVVK